MGDAWTALPYQLAGAVARHLVLHAHKLDEARVEFEQLRQNDPAESKPKTVAAKNEWQKLVCCQRHVVMNQRTGQLASPDWLQKHVKVVDGRPEPRNAKNKIWFLVLSFRLQANSQVELALGLAKDEPLLPVRCFRLSGEEENRLPDLLRGYDHLSEDAEIQALQGVTVL